MSFVGHKNFVKAAPGLTKHMKSWIDAVDVALLV